MYTGIIDGFRQNNVCFQVHDRYYMLIHALAMFILSIKEY